MVQIYGFTRVTAYKNKRKNSQFQHPPCRLLVSHILALLQRKTLHHKARVLQLAITVKLFNTTLKKIWTSSLSIMSKLPTWYVSDTDMEDLLSLDHRWHNFRTPSKIILLKFFLHYVGECTNPSRKSPTNRKGKMV